ncbi:hypothetical protein [Ensifer sp. ENS08]|uniref:hypothetical protein n=1 Tax=Ensifer sp. ENS08 TaxID=2769273 RepID=UPI0017877ACE|nr:hypothetical protein [Ensifer sp. ENS08]MBD9570805.1 hypothetical protein [Ensifer sp. ENS08]
MPRGGKDETTNADVEPLGETPDDNETFAQALAKAGFKPANVGHRVMSPGKRRETLKKRPSGNADK